MKTGKKGEDMQRGAGKQKNWIMWVALALFIMVLISIHLVGKTNARYVILGSGVDSASTASFAFVVKDGQNPEGSTSSILNLGNIKKPGDEQKYYFTVSNFDGSAVSEMNQNYTLNLQLNGSMPITCTIAPVDGATGTESSAILTAALTDGAAQPVSITSTETLNLPAFTETTHQYILTAYWPQEKKDAKYASHSGAAEVLLTVSAEQIQY